MVSSLVVSSQETPTSHASLLSDAHEAVDKQQWRTAKALFERLSKMPIPMGDLDDPIREKIVAARIEVIFPKGEG